MLEITYMSRYQPRHYRNFPAAQTAGIRTVAGAAETTPALRKKLPDWLVGRLVPPWTRMSIAIMREMCYFGKTKMEWLLAMP
jgi:hypothetical protein